MPSSKVTVNASFWQIVQRTGNPFSDVPNNYWAFDVIEWASSNGYMNGITTTAFHPGGTITRQRMVIFLYRYYKLKGYAILGDNYLQDFLNIDRVSDYAKDHWPGLQTTALWKA